MKYLMKTLKRGLVPGMTVLATALGFAFFPMSGSAQAGPILDFGIVAPTSGSISYAGGAAPLVGTDIEVDNVVGTGGTLLNNNGVVTCINCKLSFTTGAFTGNDSNNWFFAPGGSITITGGVDLTGDGDADDVGDIAVGSILLSGSFTDTVDVTTFGPSGNIVGAAFVDTKDQRLTDFYGFPNVSYDGFFNISFSSPTLPPAGFISIVVLSGGVANTDQIPIPGNNPPVCSGAIGSVSQLWPPNHKMQALSILNVTDPDGDLVSITITGITQDEPVKGKGSGNTSPDGSGVGTAIALMRAERSGIGNGRVYQISFTASDGNGGQCSGSVEVCVPHDRGANKTCVDDGQVYDSTIP